MGGVLIAAGDSGTSVVAIYGAVTGTLAIFVSGVSVWWTIRRDRTAKKIRVEVSLTVGVAGLPAGIVEILIIKPVNRSEFAVTVVGAGLQLADGHEFVILRPFYSELPAELAANAGSTDIMVRLDSVVEAVPGFDLAQPQQAYVTLKSGERFTSPRKPKAAKRQRDDGSS
jgi:hypothetical protein